MIIVLVMNVNNAVSKFAGSKPSGTDSGGVHVLSFFVPWNFKYPSQNHFLNIYKGNLPLASSNEYTYVISNANIQNKLILKNKNPCLWIEI